MIRWITEYLGTSAWEHANNIKDIYIVDVRDLVDKGGNQPQIVKSKIEVALTHLQQNEKVVICCDYGMSRSNAIAAGVLAIRENISIEEAIRRIMAATGESAIKIEVLSAVRKSLDATFQRTSTLEKDDLQILVTGSSGFIGASLLPKLKQRYRVVAPTSQELNLVRDTVILDLLIKEQRISTILHLANPRIYTTNEAMGTAMVMLKNVLDVCKENGLFLVYLSNWEVYSGYKTQELMANESLAPCPGGSYGQTKFLSEALIEHYRHHHGLNCTILRSSPVYGLGSDRPKFIWNFLHKALHHKEITTHKYLNGFPKLDLLHIDDLCSAIIVAIEHHSGKVINLGTGIGTSTTQIAENIVEYTNSQSKIHHLEIDGYASNILMDISRAIEVMKWHPKINLFQGIKMIIDADASCSTK
jgi:UDP-glucuronate decarboxylase